MGTFIGKHKYRFVEPAHTDLFVVELGHGNVVFAKNQFIEIACDLMPGDFLLCQVRVGFKRDLRGFRKLKGWFPIADYAPNLLNLLSLIKKLRFVRIPHFIHLPHLLQDGIAQHINVSFLDR